MKSTIELRSVNSVKGIYYGVYLDNTLVYWRSNLEDANNLIGLLKEHIRKFGVTPIEEVISSEKIEKEE